MVLWNVDANYDPEAHVWYAIDSDIPGLAVDADTLEALEVKIGNVLDDLLEIHAEDIVDKSRLQGPHTIRMVAFYEGTLPLLPERGGSWLHETGNCDIACEWMPHGARGQERPYHMDWAAGASAVSGRRQDHVPDSC